MTSRDHEFGGVSTDLKLSVVEGYLKAFTSALRRKFPQLWYIDAFAGTGERTVKVPAREGDLFEPATPDRIERHRGSALRAIEIQPSFNRLIFMDIEPRHCVALRELRAAYPGRKIDIIEENANTAIRRIVAAQRWESTRAVMFLDPYGMQVDWETLKVIQSTEAIDVWYFVSLPGLFRQAARDPAAIDESKRAALNRMTGTNEWEQVWYQRRTVEDLFGRRDEGARTADVQRMESWFRNRLSELFPKVLEPLHLRHGRGSPQSVLYFAMSNPDPVAIGLATKIAGHILNSGRSSQVRPR